MSERFRGEGSGAGHNAHLDDGFSDLVDSLLQGEVPQSFSRVPLVPVLPLLELDFETSPIHGTDASMRRVVPIVAHWPHHHNRGCHFLRKRKGSEVISVVGHKNRSLYFSNSLFCLLLLALQHFLALQEIRG